MKFHLGVLLWEVPLEVDVSDSAIVSEHVSVSMNAARPSVSVGVSLWL